MRTETDRGYTVELPMFPKQPHRARCDACSKTHLLDPDLGVAEIEAADWYAAHANTAPHRRRVANDLADT